MERQSQVRDLIGALMPIVSREAATGLSNLTETLVGIRTGLDESVVILDALTARDACPETRRRKRGLLNFGGSVLSFLFGVLDSGYVDKIKALEDMAKGAVHALDQHVSVLKETHDAILAQDMALEKIRDYVSSELDNIKSHIRLEDLLGLLQTQVVNIHASLFKLQTRVHQWHSGSLRNNMLSGDFLGMITKEIHRKSNRDFHYELLSTQVSAIAYCDGQFGLSMVVSIPEDAPFILYEVNPLPMYNAKLDQFLIIELPELVAIGQGKNMEISFRTFNEECRAFHTHYSCPQGVSPVRNNAHSCVNDLLLATDLERTLEQCHHRFDKVADHMVKLIRGTSSFKYILPQATGCKLTCPPGIGRDRFRTFSLHGSGIFHIPQGCSLNVGDLEMFHSTMGMLYYNESLITYDHDDGDRLLEIARASQGKRETLGSSQFNRVGPGGSRSASGPADVDHQLLATWVVVLISASAGFICSCLAMLPLYRKIYFPPRHDSALKGHLGPKVRDPE